MTSARPRRAASGEGRKDPSTTTATTVGRSGVEGRDRPKSRYAHAQVNRPARPRQTSHGLWVSSRGGGVVGPGGGLVVGGSGFEAAVEDADEAVAELAQRGVVAGAAGAQRV